MQKRSLAQELKCTVDEAEKVINEIFQYFHGKEKKKHFLFIKSLGVRTWLEDVAVNASRDGFVRSAWNLSVSMQNLSDFEVRQKAPHFIIQVLLSHNSKCVTSCLGFRFGNCTQANE